MRVWVSLVIGPQVVCEFTGDFDAPLDAAEVLLSAGRMLRAMPKPLVLSGVAQGDRVRITIDVNRSL